MRLFFSAGAGHSHIAPPLPLAVAAQNQGHDVVFATGPNAIGHAQAAGLSTVAVGQPPDEAAGRRPWGKYSPAELAAMSPDEKLAYVVTVMAELGTDRERRSHRTEIMSPHTRPAGTQSRRTAQPAGTARFRPSADEVVIGKQSRVVSADSR